MSDSHPLPSIDLDLARKLHDEEYRERFFLAEASAEIARQLIKLRKRRGYSQTELADRAGTQQPAVSRAEQADYQNWSFNALRKLTNAMGGRLRVEIDAWEDVLPEYLPEEHEPIVLPAPEKAGAKPKEGGKRQSPQSAAMRGEAASPFPALGAERELNREHQIAALRRPERQVREGGYSQWN